MILISLHHTTAAVQTLELISSTAALVLPSSCERRSPHTQGFALIGDFDATAGREHGKANSLILITLSSNITIVQRL